MRVLIDGHNALAALDIEGRDHEQQRRRLLRRVREQDPEACVYFDARGAPPDMPRSFREEGVRVVYCRKREADEVILADVDQATQPRRALVVTDDRELAGRARLLGARSSHVREFVARRKKPSPQDDEERKPTGPGGFTASDFGLPDEIDLDGPPPTG